MHSSGIPSLPSHKRGYRHFSHTPLFLYQGQLFHIPPSESERTLFTVAAAGDDTAYMAIHPRGGHTYYNNRSMERVTLRMQWLEKVMNGGEDWEEKYRAMVARHERTRR